LNKSLLAGQFHYRQGLPSGAVAQLGERGLCKPEVVGSIPISSTKFQVRA
jgi:hypothetical protein